MCTVQAAPTPLIPDAKHLLRQVRYVHLNPCRGGLVQDPLCWRMARCLQYRGRNFAEWFHGYVSGDPHTSVAGTPFPTGAPSSAVATVALHDIARALDITPDAARRIARKPDPQLVRIGQLYLGDSRLRM